MNLEPQKNENCLIKQVSTTSSAVIRNKPKFCVRILQLLRETLNDQKKINEIGLSWCDDGIHFICNSQILGKYLNLKANSINTNFRAHYFQIGIVQADEIKRAFGNLPDPRNWKMRHNVKFPFTSRSVDSEAENIPCMEKGLRGGIELVPETSASMIPELTINLLKNEKKLIHQIEFLLQPVNFSVNWKTAFLTQATNDFIRIAGMNTSVKPAYFIQAIINNANPKIDENSALVVERNLSSLLRFSTCNSQSITTIGFLEYLKILLRYGLLHHIAHSILELSSVAISDEFYNSSFQPWFIPSSDMMLANEILSRNSLDWVIKLSVSAPNMFSIISGSNNGIVASHITFNPMPMKQDLRFSIEIEGGKIESESSWERLLVSILGLHMPTIERPVVRHVPRVEHKPYDKNNANANNNDNNFLNNNINFGITNPNFNLISNTNINNGISINNGKGSNTEAASLYSSPPHIEDASFVSPTGFGQSEFLNSQTLNQTKHNEYFDNDLNGSQTIHWGMTPDLFNSQNNVHSGMSNDMYEL